MRIGGLAIGALSRERSPLETASDIEVGWVRLVWLSPETAVKQVIHHADLTAADYLLLPDLLEYGEVMAIDGRRISFFFDFGRRGLYRAIVKQTRTNELFLTTFHSAQARNLRRARLYASQTQTRWRTVGPVIRPRPATPHCTLVPEGTGQRQTE